MTGMLQPGARVRAIAGPRLFHGKTGTIIDVDKAVTFPLGVRFDDKHIGKAREPGGYGSERVIRFRLDEVEKL